MRTVINGLDCESTGLVQFRWNRLCCNVENAYRISRIHGYVFFDGSMLLNFGDCKSFSGYPCLALDWRLGVTGAGPIRNAPTLKTILKLEL